MGTLKQMRLIDIVYLYFKHTVKAVFQYLFKENVRLLRIPNAKGVALTFDDGPHPVHTLKIIEILSKRNIRATFFLLGSQIKTYPEVTKALVDGGHEIGNHTYAHNDLKKNSLRGFFQAVILTENEIDKLIPSTEGIRLLRTPYGRFSLKLLWYARKYHLKLVGWTVDSNDSYIIEVSQLCEYMQQLSIKKGDILLFHEDYLHTIEALPNILDHLMAKGIQFFTVGELLSEK
jgi:peptidoglycan-N-acetylglucosamine deacetylase